MSTDLTEWWNNRRRGERLFRDHAEHARVYADESLKIERHAGPGDHVALARHHQTAARWIRETLDTCYPEAWQWPDGDYR